MEDTPTRVIAVVLSESEWQALLNIEREPVGWLRRKIRERLERADRVAATAPTRPDQPLAVQ